MMVDDRWDSIYCRYLKKWRIGAKSDCAHTSLPGRDGHMSSIIMDKPLDSNRVKVFLIFLPGILMWDSLAYIAVEKSLTI